MFIHVHIEFKSLYSRYINLNKLYSQKKILEKVFYAYMQGCTHKYAY